MFINKEKYSNFEKEIGNNFYISKSYKTNLVPTNGKPSIVKNNKVVISLDFINKDGKYLSELVKNNKIKDLPEADYISLYHIGNQKYDKVKFGYDSSKKMFLYPCCDFGGLTNYRQKLGETSKLSKSGIKISKNSSDLKIINNIYENWKKRSKKDRFYGKIKQKLSLFLKSVIKYLNLQSDFSNVIIKFWKVPPIKKIVYTSKDISKFNGNYYIRVFGEGDNKYAKKINPNKNLYCSIMKPEWNPELLVITPNINKNNILNEYQIY